MTPSDFGGGHEGYDSWQNAEDEEFNKAQLVSLEVEIVGAHVPTWRQVILPATYPLDEVHFIIMMLFDWGGSFPYCFKRGQMVYEYPQAGSVDLPELRGKGCTRFDSTKYLLSDALPVDGATIEYYYDPGDLWQLSIARTGTMTGAEYPFSMLPVCLDGEGNNPPEDVGGVDGYKGLCDDLASPGSPDYQSARFWLGLEDDEDFEPAYFDIEMANYLLARDQVDALEDMLVPKDPAKLRELVKDLLAEEAVNEAVDIIRISRLGESLNTPEGKKFFESMLREIFADQQPPEGAGGAGDGAEDPFTAAGFRTAGAGAAGACEPHLHVSVQSGNPFQVVKREMTERPAGASGAARGGAPREPTPREPAAPHPPAPSERAEELRSRRPQPNPRLDEFEVDLRASGISEATIKKHLANAELFLNVYLVENKLSLSEGSYRMDDYFGFFLPRNCPWMSATAKRESITSLRKFYKSMFQRGAISAEDYAFMEESTREFKSEWLDSDR